MNLKDAIAQLKQEESTVERKKRKRTEAEKARRKELDLARRDEINAKRREAYAEKTKNIPLKINPDNVQIHGTTNSYQRWKCRCDECRAVYNQKATARRLKRYEYYKSIDYKGVPHGTKYGYNHTGCRCPLCREAIRLDHQQQRRKNGVRPRPRAPHGSYAKYNRGCRCEPCTEANREYIKSYRKTLRKEQGVT